MRWFSRRDSKDTHAEAKKRAAVERQQLFQMRSSPLNQPGFGADWQTETGNYRGLDGPPDTTVKGLVASSFFDFFKLFLAISPSRLLDLPDWASRTLCAR